MGKPPSANASRFQDVVHLCAVAMGKAGVVYELDLMLRSVRATSRAEIAVHVLVDEHTDTAVRHVLLDSRRAWYSA